MKITLEFGPDEQAEANRAIHAGAVFFEGEELVVIGVHAREGGGAVNRGFFDRRVRRARCIGRGGCGGAIDGADARPLPWRALVPDAH